MALSTIQDYITEARTLLQDQTVPYRYTDAELAGALGLALLDARKMRPELFLDTNGVPQDITRASAMNTSVVMEPMYRRAFVYAIAGEAMLRDEEEASQAQAAGYKNHFIANLLTLAG